MTKIKLWKVVNRCKPPEKRRTGVTIEGKRYRVLYMKTDDMLSACDLCHFVNDSTVAEDLFCPMGAYRDVDDGGRIHEQRICIMVDEGLPEETTFLVRATKQGWAEYIARKLA